MTKPSITSTCAVILFSVATLFSARAAGANTAPELFPDEVLLKGKGFEIRRSSVEKAYAQFEANAVIRGRPIPPEQVEGLEMMLLDRLLVTQLLLGEGTREDTEKAEITAKEFTADTRKKAGSDASFNRQLLAMGFTEEDFTKQILERAICEEIIERVLKNQVVISEADAQRHYDENKERLKRPEMVRASHILLTTVDPATGQKLPEEALREKRRLADLLLKRARQGEDFRELVITYSDDPGAAKNKGEYVFGRGQMVSEFEAAAFGLKEGQISDIVTTQFGYHIIKTHQHIPAEQIEFDKIKAEIMDSLRRAEMQERLLPEYLLELKAAASLEYLNGAAPPPIQSSASTTPATPPVGQEANQSQ